MADATDALTGAPVRSLYGEHLGPAAADLAGLAAVLVDLPDVGARFYTYSWTMSHVLEACAEADVPLIVLDRPNPLGGDLSKAEGPILDPSCQSLVGRWPIPIRHGLTIGELARHFARTRKLDVEVEVVTHGGWCREQTALGTATRWMPPSPNLPSPETALLYPGTCLLEGVNLAEGRGTAHPFRLAAAPFLDSEATVDHFNALGLPGVRAVPYAITPPVRDHAGEYCPAVLLLITDPAAHRPVRTGVNLLSSIAALHPGALTERRGIAMPGESDATSLERLFGLRGAFEQITSGVWDAPDALQVPQWPEEVAADLLY